MCIYLEKMLYAGRLILVIAAVAASAVALPNHLKAVVTDKEPVPQGSGAAASFGPFSAKAGVGEGGLYAAADSPLGNAGAGVGSGGLGASASTGGGLGASAGGGTGGGHPTQHKPGHHQPGLFDGIFNIPISVLQAVNQYLNNRGPITKPVHRRRGHEPSVYKTVTPEQSGAAAGSEAGAEAASDSKAGAAAESHSSASSSSSGGISGSGSGGSGHHPVMINKRVNYDDIFAIPISALKSVNQLLNGKK